MPPRSHQRHPPDPGRPKNAYIREDRVLAHLLALDQFPADAQPTVKRRQTRAGQPLVTAVNSPAKVIGYLRSHQISVTYDPAAKTLRAGTGPAAQTSTGTAL